MPTNPLSTKCRGQNLNTIREFGWMVWAIFWPDAKIMWHQADFCHGPYPMLKINVPAFSTVARPAKATALFKSLFQR